MKKTFRKPPILPRESTWWDNWWQRSFVLTTIVQRFNHKTLVLKKPESTLKPQEAGFLDPFQRVPDCRKLRVELGNLSELALANGIEVRGHHTIEITEFGNYKMNRYRQHQIRRLNQAVDSHRPELFFRIASALIKRSNVFMVIQLNKVLPGWYKRLSLSTVFKSIREFQKIAASESTSLDFTRIYIEKADGSERPLGVPTPGWRIYLGLWASFLAIWLKDSYPKEQHGFFPKKGTLTAWKQLLKVINSPDIFEYDLTKFFDRVNIQYISQKLLEAGTPKSVVYMLENINRSTAKPSCGRGPDDIMRERELISSASESTIREGMWFGPVKSYIRDHGLTAWNQLLAAEFGWVPNYSTSYRLWLWYSFKYQELQWALGNSLDPLLEFSEVFRGVPQGAATSPILSGYILKDSLLSRYPTVGYADDGVHYGVLPDDILKGDEEMTTAGIHYNPDKSGWIKRNGEWLRPLKFLGLIYDGKKNELCSKTRKGANLVYDKDELIQALVDEKVDAQMNSGSRRSKRWVDFIKSKIAGLVQSRMYLGEWAPDKILQDFVLRAETNSWVHHRCKSQWGRVSAVRRLGSEINVFNASSIACASLLAYQRKFKRPKRNL